MWPSALDMAWLLFFLWKSFSMYSETLYVWLLMVLVLLQEKYLYTYKNIAKKPSLDEFLRVKHFEQYCIENCGKQN